MFKIICAAVITAGICFFVNAFNNQIENTRKHNIYYNTATVVSIGQCKESKCSFSYKKSTGEVDYGFSENPLSLGQIVYQQCWTEKVRGQQCYTVYEPSKNDE